MLNLLSIKVEMGNVPSDEFVKKFFCGCETLEG